METNFDQSSEDLEVVDAPLDDDMAQIVSDGSSSENKDFTLSLDDISTHDSLFSSPSTINKRGKHSSNKGKVLDNVPSSKYIRIKKNNSILKNQDVIIKEESGNMVNMEVLHD